MAALAAAIFAQAGFTAAFAQGYGFENLRTFGNGATQLRMSRDCIVLYDPAGYRMRDTGCSDSEITRADQQFAVHRAQSDNARRFRNERRSGLPAGAIKSLQNGQTEIRMSGNCVVLYNPFGYRLRNMGCTGGEISRADQEYAMYRR